MCVRHGAAGAERAPADLPIAQSTRSIGVDCAIDMIVSAVLLL
jgi:hypothetical protein